MGRGLRDAFQYHRLRQGSRQWGPGNKNGEDRTARQSCGPGEAGLRRGVYCHHQREQASKDPSRGRRRLHPLLRELSYAEVSLAAENGETIRGCSLYHLRGIVYLEKMESK